jgi:amidase
MSANEAADRIRRRQTSSRELTEALLQRIDAVDSSLNAIVELRSEEALAEASAADAADAESRGRPLHGVPMTVKEAFNVAGLHTTWGNPLYETTSPTATQQWSPD